MYYPLNLNGIDIKPLFGDLIKGDPHLFDFSSDNPKTLQYDAHDFKTFNDLIFLELKNSGKRWGVGKYLEERKNVLRNYPNIITEKRYYHLGLDIIVPYDTPMCSPLDATVYSVGKETRTGNYGGYLMLKHQIKEVVFYSFYGHLKTPHLVKIGDKLNAGEVFSKIGRESDSGGWFCHVHFQILTQKAVDEGLTDWGYAPLELLPRVDEYFPSPYFLFKF